LTRRERTIAWSLTLAPSLLAVAGVVLLLTEHGVAHGIGIALLLLGVVVMPLPVSAILRASLGRPERDEPER
jgi:drug/metabolite transporter (DMT)-like permease